MDAGHLLGPTGPLARGVPGYEHRPGQIRMARAVQDLLQHDGVLLIEAGTGIGKTWAYLIPAALSGRRVLVSTGTRALQDQIMEKDLPALKDHLGIEIDAACVKGLGNYLCLRRFNELSSSADAMQPRFARALPALRDWIETTRTGDRAALASIPEEDPIWSRVVSGSDTRIGARCDYYEDCFVTRVRRRAESAQLIVVNHHLFFADLALRDTGFASVLPDYDAVIFDEAHQIEDTATLFFGSRLSTAMLERLVRDARTALQSERGDKRQETRLLDGVLQRSSNFFAALPAGVNGGRVPLPSEAIPQEELFALDNALAELGSFCRDLRLPRESVLQIARRTEQLRNALGSLEAPGQVSWAQGSGRSPSVGSSPIDVGPLLRERLHERVPCTVFTSATLTTGGDFRFLKRRLGIDAEVSEELVESPFRYEEQAALYAPKHLPDPRASDFPEVAAKEILELVRMSGGGAFVLSTSLRMMRLLAERVGPELEYEWFVQGDAPKQTLLDRFRDQGNAVLFATASFWEGVDVPGSALRLVVIDKLPFEVPSDPVVAARCARLDETGESSFMRYLVPAAALSLKQGFGRLIRTTRDRGVVAILDSRIRRKGYGKVFLRSLPPARVCDTLEEVREFLISSGTPLTMASLPSPRKEAP
ncbi:MAG TPA: ATP-dependent DNA helicase [Polyangiales bacterium]|nr:ATP-dependent DNA helicase [Polyangiales bacterium]